MFYVTTQPRLCLSRVDYLVLSCSVFNLSINIEIIDLPGFGLVSGSSCLLLFSGETDLKIALALIRCVKLLRLFPRVRSMNCQVNWAYASSLPGVRTYLRLSTLSYWELKTTTTTHRCYSARLMDDGFIKQQKSSFFKTNGNWPWWSENSDFNHQSAPFLLLYLKSSFQEGFVKTLITLIYIYGYPQLLDLSESFIHSLYLISNSP